MVTTDDINCNVFNIMFNFKDIRVRPFFNIFGAQPSTFMYSDSISLCMNNSHGKSCEGLSYHVIKSDVVLYCF